MKFTKMHGTGNDYIYLYQENIPNFSKLAKILSHRHKGIGSDGLIHLAPTKDQSCDFAMTMYNADGSQGSMCGNGIRCSAAFLYQQGYTNKTSLQILTKAGPRQVRLHPNEQGDIAQVTVAMGKAQGLKASSVTLEGQDFHGHFVSMGNPHFVLLWENLQQLPLEQWGPALERHPAFGEEGVNVEFYSPTAQGFAMRVWERGSGETQSCGTGACACLAVGASQGTLPLDSKVTASLQGGSLSLWQEGDHIFLQGDAVTVYQGEITENFLQDIGE